MISETWKWLLRMGWLVGGFLLLSFLFQGLNLFFNLYEIHPWIAIAFAVVLTVGLLGVARWVYVRIWRFPKALTPPTIPDPQNPRNSEIAAYGRYLIQYLQRLEQNPYLSDTEQTRAGEGVGRLRRELDKTQPATKVLALFLEMEEEYIVPLLQRLKEVSSKEVRSCVRDVMFSVTFSPYQSVDMVVVIYRNVTMILRIIAIHATRPRLKEQWLILSDTLKIVITVNFINAGRNLFESLFANLPFLGRVVDDMAQGLGAGYLTSATGYAAIDRCAAFRGWSQDQARKHLMSQARTFLGDVRDTFTKDVLPDMKTRITRSAPSDITKKPGFWDTILDGVNESIDATTELTEQYLFRPVMRTGTTISRGVAGSANRGIKGMLDFLSVFKTPPQK